MLQDLRESGHVAGKKCLVLFEQRNRQDTSSQKACQGRGGSDGLRGERNSGRIVEITLSQKEKIPLCQDETASNGPNIIEELS